MSGWAGGVKRSILTKKRAKSYIYIYIYISTTIHSDTSFSIFDPWRLALGGFPPPCRPSESALATAPLPIHPSLSISSIHPHIQITYIYIYISASSCHERVRISGVILTLRLLSSLSWQVPSCPPWSHRASRRRRGGTGDGARRTSSPSGRSKTWPPTRPHCPRPAIVSGKGSSAARRRRWRWWSCGGSVRTT